VKRVSHALGQVVHAWEGDLGAETLPRAPKLEWWVGIFLINEQLVLYEF
jgi:hypothetical protein